MRTLIISEFVTLDGVMEAPGGEPTHPHTGWVVPYGVPEVFEYKLEETLAAESLLLGRVTYESFASSWPGSRGRVRRHDEHDAQAHGDEPEALAWNAAPLSARCRWPCRN